MTLESKITLHWNDSRLSHIETPNLVLRPIVKEDLSDYKKIFNPTAMALFRGSFNEQRFETWLQRWQSHNFSALAILDRTSEKTQVIGHAILGHGDYEEIGNGWSEMALILHQSYWNKSFADPTKEIGINGKTGLGTEAVSAIMEYAKELTQRNSQVPGDIDPSLANKVSQKNGFYENGKCKAVFQPFTELRATCDKTNAASVRILRKAFKVSEGKGTQEEVQGNRPGYLFKIKTKDLLG